MIRWLYRLLFARRSVYVLEHPEGPDQGRVRLTVYDADREDLDKADAMLLPYLQDGWRLVTAPPGSFSQPD